MPLIARKDGKDVVKCVDGNPGTPCEDNKKKCDNPSEQVTEEGSSTVFVAKIGVVREGDKMVSHPSPACGCGAHQPSLSSYSAHVYADGKRIGRKGDEYSAGHVIDSGAPGIYDGSPQA